MKEKKNISKNKSLLILLIFMGIALLFLSGNFLSENFLYRKYETKKASLNSSEAKNEKLKNNYAFHPIKDLHYRQTFNLSNKKKLQRVAATHPAVIIHFDGVPISAQITKAPLKYNKDFAYSLTLDDGKEDAYTAAYPLLAGGYSSETGVTYPGLSYTDGCGNTIFFKAGIAINSVSSNGSDPHQGTPGSITWDQLKDLYYKKWDVFNHSYSHQYGAGTDYNAQIIDNNSYVKNKTGIDMTHFVIPSGDGEYVNPAFNNKMKAVYNQNDAPGAEGLLVNSPLTLANFKLFRQYLNDDNYNSYSTMVDMVAAKSNASNHYWYNEFSHNVSQAPKGGSILFSTFKSHMEKLEASYGSKGTDKIWMAPLQEVYEYLSVRETVVTTTTQENDKVYLYTNFDQVPKDLRRYAMTFIVNSDLTITHVECATASHISFKGTGTTKIINIEWEQHPDVSPTGFDNQQHWHNENMNVYPNPVENKITLSFPGNKIEKVFVSVFNEQGIEYKLGESEVINERATVDLKKLDLRKGAYIIRITSEDGRFQFSKVILKE